MSKAKEEGVRSPLFGCLISKLNPYNADEMARLADLDSASGSRPWDAAKFKKELSRSGVHGIVIEHNGFYLGTAIVSVGHLKVSLIELMVHGNHRRRGIGTALLKSLDNRFLTDVRNILEIEVPELNTAMQMFLRSNKIKATDVLRGEETDHYLFVARRGYSEMR